MFADIDYGAFLDRKLSRLPGLETLATDARITSNGYHLYVFRVDPQGWDGVDRNLFIKALAAEGIPCASGYVPLYNEAVFTDTDGDVARILTAMGRMEELKERTATPGT